MKTLNESQVKELFAREAVLIGRNDCVPAFRAAEIFGQKAVEHTHRLDHSGTLVSRYGIGDFTLYALTLRGFQTAASYYNVQQLREAEAHG